MLNKTGYDELITLLIAESVEYYSGRSSIPDAMFNALLNIAQQYELEFPEHLHTDSPTQKIGITLFGSDKIRHPVRMWSLSNAYDIPALEKFIKRTKIGEFAVEYKYDGLSIDLIYVNGKFTTALTRGDGIYGTDVTFGVGQIEAIPKEISVGDGVYVVHVEIILPSSALEAINAELDQEETEPYANCRNAAAGILQSGNRFCPLLVHKAFELAAGDIDTEYSMRMFNLEELGFDAGFRRVVEACDVPEAVLQLASMREHLDFEIDGVVVKAEHYSDRLELGYGTKAPKFSIAYKFAPETAHTVLEDVVFQVSGMGFLNPVAKLSAVTLGGVEVTSANLHNLSIMRTLDLQIGDTVEVARLADVSNQIIGVVISERPVDAYCVEVPTKCPSCGEKLDEMSERKVTFRCVNHLKCPDQVLARFKRYLSPEGMAIPLNKNVIAKLITLGMKLIPDIYTLNPVHFKVAGMSEKQAAVTKLKLDEALKRPLHKHLAVLGIPGVSFAGAVEWANLYGNLQALVDDLDDIEARDELPSNLIEFYESELGGNTLKGMSKLLG